MGAEAESVDPSKTTIIAVRWHPDASPQSIAIFEHTLRESIAPYWRKFGVEAIELDTR